MDNIVTFVLFAVGFGVLLKGGDLLVDGASSIAKRLGVSSLVIGLTIVAFGTSLPELMVNIFSAASGKTDLAIGNVIGSNIANILLVLGITALIYPLSVKRSTVWKEIPLSLLAIVILAVMASDRLIDGGASSSLTRIDGLVLLSYLIIFIYYTFGISRVYPADKPEVKPQTYSPSRSYLMVISGLVALFIGGKWVVDGAVAFSLYLGISESIVGLTILAIGTSLPEIATSVIAAKKKDADIAIGNVVGSNIFNVFWVLGATAVISPLPFSFALLQDVWVAVFATLLFFAFMFLGRKHVLEKRQGLMMLLAYFAYLFYLVAREFWL